MLLRKRKKDVYLYGRFVKRPYHAQRNFVDEIFEKKLRYYNPLKFIETEFTQ